MEVSFNLFQIQKVLPSAVFGCIHSVSVYQDELNIALILQNKKCYAISLTQQSNLIIKSFILKEWNNELTLMNTNVLSDNVRITYSCSLKWNYNEEDMNHSIC